MRPAISFIVLYVFALLAFGEASVFLGTLEENLKLFPQCSQECMTLALGAGICSPSDGHCVCTDSTFRSNVTVCLIKTCPTDDIVSTQTTTIRICGAPIRDQSGQVIIVTIIMSTLAASFIILRFVYKLRVAKLAVEQDDWFALACLLATIPNCVITVHGSMANGLGKDAFNLTSVEIVRFARYLYIMIILYYAEAIMVKLTFICFYRRAFPSRGVQQLLSATFIVTGLLGCFFILLAAFQCQPAKFFWTRWLGVEDGKCLNPHIISYCNAALGIILDLWIIAVPLAQLPQLQLHWKKKIGVGLMFCVGIFDTVVSMVRLKFLVDFNKTTNSTWAFANVTVWSTVEICVGIMCACLPTLRLLLIRSFPILSSTTYRSNGNSRLYLKRTPITPLALPRRSLIHPTRASACKVASLDNSPALYDEEGPILAREEFDLVISGEGAKKPFLLATMNVSIGVKKERKTFEGSLMSDYYGF